MEELRADAHVGDTAGDAVRLCGRVRGAAERAQRAQPLLLPVVPAGNKRGRGGGAVRQGAVGLCVCQLLHCGADVYARVHHADAAAAAVAAVRAQVARQAEPLHGADVHGYLLWHQRPRRAVGHEPHARVVLSHRRHVRGLPAPLARGRAEVLLSVPGGLLGAAGHRAGAGHGEAAQGLQGARGAPHCQSGAHPAQLPLPLYAHGTAHLHHARH